jgi:hypothetical protein
VTYHGHPVENLTVTRLVFWNAGREPIHQTDIPSKYPCRISVPKGNRILGVKTRFVKNPANLFSCILSADGSNADIKFEYLGKDDGGILDVIHTGKSDSDLHLESLFKGSERLVRRHSIAFHRWPYSLSLLVTSDIRIPFAISLFIGPAVMVVDYKFGWFGGFYKYLDNPWVTTIFPLIFTVAIMWGLAYYLLRARLPSGFSFMDETENQRSSDEA